MNARSRMIPSARSLHQPLSIDLSFLAVFTILLALTSLPAANASAQESTEYRAGGKHTFALGKDDFLLDGKPFQIISGEMHFARIPREYWRHRLQMARAMGLNTVATYVFWNYHEPQRGKFDFTTESRDIAEFIRTAGEEGLWVIVRPGPYACAEWEFGGYPWWLLREDSLVVRGMDPRFLEASRLYLKRLGEEVAPLQVTKGGPVLMVQVENEYGSFGSDKVFMGTARDQMIAAGFDVPLFTADGPSQCKNGYVTGVLPAINGDEDPQSIRDTVKKWNNGSGPFFSPEFYPGWLDHWGEEHSLVAAKENTAKFEGLIAAGISVNLYMFHGGTNFGFTSGANFGGHFQPQPTSYDYDAPLDEAGRPTPKYSALREAVLRHLPPGAKVPDPPPANPVIEIPPVTLDETALLFAQLPEPALSQVPLPMELIGQGTGFVLYRTLLGPNPGGKLVIGDLRDYAVVYLDGKKVGSLDRRHKQQTIDLPAASGTPATLDILVENGGRINYGRQMVDNRKGITREVLYNGEPLKEWKIYPLPMDSPAPFRFARPSGTGAGKTAGVPALHRGTFTLAKTGDAFLDLGAWGKGCVWVNGRHLGRFWSIGPQQTLYCPGAWLKVGGNEIVVFEIEDTGARTVRGLPEPVLNQLRPDPLAPPPPVREQGSFILDPSGAALSGSFTPADSEQLFPLAPVKARYFALESVSSWRDDPFASAAELWLLDEGGKKIDRAGWKVVSVESEELTAEDGRAENAIDGDRETIWHTQWGSAKPPHPHHIIVDIGGVKNVGGFAYLSRRGNSPAKIREFRLYLREGPFTKQK
jgi:beta-galactosidase